MTEPTAGEMTPEMLRALVAQDRANREQACRAELEQAAKIILEKHRCALNPAVVIVAGRIEIQPFNVVARE